MLADTSLGTTVPESRPVFLDVVPVIPRWLAVLGALGLLWLLWALSWLNPANPQYGHQAGVNTVQFDGLGRTAISSSNDQTAILWNAPAFFWPWRNHELRQVAEADKAIRVGRYRPLQNNQLAVGLENGEIQLWDLLRGDRLGALAATGQRDDRVLDLRFSDDARTLWSSHGSGMVLRWTLEPGGDRTAFAPIVGQQPSQREDFGFAAYALALVGNQRDRLLVGGRYNRLAAWDWQANRQQAIDYLPGGQDDYITSLATAEARPNWVAIADNRGWLSVVDLEPCLRGGDACRVIDRWRGNAEGQSLRAIALTRQGCYLASAGDDGRVVLWPLVDGRRDGRFAAGEVIAHHRTKLNGVDVRIQGDRAWLVSGADDSRVRLYRHKLPTTDCP